MFYQSIKRCAFVALLCLMLPLSAPAKDKAPIKIGAVTSLSGVFSQQGEEVLRGIKFAVEQANKNGGIEGRQVLVKVADDESTPKAGRRAAGELAREGYDLLIGAISSSISLAISQSLERWDALYVSVISKSDLITGKECSARMFRTNQSTRMDLAMFGKWLKGVEGRHYGIIAADYTWGRGSAKFFKQTMESLGRDVVVELYPPLGTTDFAPYIAQLMAADLDAVWVAEVGRDAITFAKQADAYGLTSKSNLIGHALLLNFMVDATGDSLEGVWGNLPWGPSIQTEMNREFVQAWKKKYGRLPTENEAQAYNGMQTIFEGVLVADSVKPAAVADALEGATLDTIYGSVTMRAADHQLVVPNYMGQVKRVNGNLRPVIEKSFDPAVYAGPSGQCEM